MLGLGDGQVQRGRRLPARLGRPVLGGAPIKRARLLPASRRRRPGPRAGTIRWETHARRAPRRPPRRPRRSSVRAPAERRPPPAARPSTQTVSSTRRRCVKRAPVASREPMLSRGLDARRPGIVATGMRLMGFAGRMAACALALSACHAGAGVAPAAKSALPGPMVVVERAETGPITAIAGHAPSLWAVGAPGLRRWDVTSGDWELVGDAQLAGAHITALAADEDGSAWVAHRGRGRPLRRRPAWRLAVSGDGLARRGDRAGRARARQGRRVPGPADQAGFSATTATAGRSSTASTAPASAGWASTATGAGVWVATNGHGIYHADDRGTAPVPGRRRRRRRPRSSAWRPQRPARTWPPATSRDRGASTR